MHANFPIKSLVLNEILTRKQTKKKSIDFERNTGNITTTR